MFRLVRLIVSTGIEDGNREAGLDCIPLIRSIHELTLIFSLDFIIFNASSSSTSPVSVSSMTSITRSASGKRLLEESFCMLIRPLNASSMTMQPRNA